MKQYRLHHIGTIGIVDMAASEDRQQVMKSTLAHFDLLCEKYPSSPWVELRMNHQGDVAVAAAGAPWQHGSADE